MRGEVRLRSPERVAARGEKLRIAPSWRPKPHGGLSCAHPALSSVLVQTFPKLSPYRNFPSQSFCEIDAERR